MLLLTEFGPLSAVATPKNERIKFMNASTHCEEFVETDRVKNKLDDLRGDPIPEEVGSDKQTRPQDPVGADVIVQCACETFIDGAGI
jgi:hypothetical protein